MSRSTGVDVITAEGLAEALDGVETRGRRGQLAVPGAGAGDRVLHHLGARTSTAYGERAGVQRIVVASIIGADRFTCRLHRVEDPPRAGASEPVRSPSRVLRAAQFHEFVEQLDGVGPPGRRDLRAGDADPARGRPHRRRGPRRARHRPRAGRTRSTTRRSGRSPARARRTSSTSRGWSRRAAARRCGSRACPTPPTRTATSTSPAACSRARTPRSQGRRSRSGSSRRSRPDHSRGDVA